ncbi:hypothetical protein JXA85_04840 [Candidatus Woesearchaeota archaeon]|nr:hypothetical protein [Candidatus Woesearchaeota archaeon]
MAVQGLIQYIQEKLHQGYAPASIRSFLLGQGYAQNDVDSAFNYLEPRKKSFSAAKFFGVTLFVIGVALMIVASLKYIGVKQDIVSELKVTTELLTATYVPGNPLKLKIDISSERKIPETLVLMYKVSDSRGKTLFYKDETVNVVKQRNFNRDIILPENINLPGEYSLDTEASIGENAFISSFGFRIVKSETKDEEDAEFRVVKEQPVIAFVKKDPTVPPARGISVDDVMRMDGA